MTWEATPGVWVRHHVFGDGAVVATRHGGREVQVRFGGQHRWVVRRELVLLAAPKASAHHPARVRSVHLPADTSPAERHEARAVVEAFRMGIVPEVAVQRWTVGRDREVAEITSWLADLGEGSLVLEGAYGAGKTHLLRYLASRALDDGWAVALVRVDPGVANAAFPLRLYGEIARAARIPIGGRIVDLREALLQAARRDFDATLGRHTLLGPMLAAARGGTLSEDDWAALLGEARASERFGFRRDYTTVANVVCNLLSGLGVMVAEVLGCAGFLVLLDEVETAQTYRYVYHWSRSLNLLRGLTLVANDDEVLLEEETETVAGVRRGKATELVYSGHLPIPYLYAMPSHLKVVLALTPGDFRGRLAEWRRSQPVVELGPVGPSELRELFERFLGAYATAYGLSGMRIDPARTFPPLLAAADEGASTRRFLKALAELCDFARLRPKVDPMTLFSRGGRVLPTPTP